MPMTANKVKPPYELTVGAFWWKVGEQEWLLPVVKTINVNSGDQVSTIYASGIVYDVTALVSGGTIGLTAVALPEELLTLSLGSTKLASGVTYDIDKPILPDAECGYIGHMSDGSSVYYYHPRVKLVRGAANHQTKTNSPVDPSVDYTIHLLTTDEGIWKVRFPDATPTDERFLAFCQAQLNTKAKLQEYTAPAKTEQASAS